MTTAPVAIDRSPCEVLACLAGEPGAFLLDVPDPLRPVTLVGCAPTAELRVEANATDPLGTIARFVDETPLRADDLPFPLAGGVLACLTYELGAHTVPGPRAAGSGPVAAVRRTAAPLAVLRRYDPLLVYDRRRDTWSLVGGAPERARWLHRLATPSTPWRGPLARRELVPGFDRDAYRTAIARIHAHLHAGDAYQVNLTQPFTVPLDGPAWALFVRLATQHPAAYGAYVDLGDRQVVVNSPELLVRRRGTHVETRPIKGTRPRGSDPARDAALVAELCADPKERAEHVMIVDLERNDLGRLCETGSIRVEAHAAVESHPTLHHLVSIVAGRLRPEIGWRELLTATFPGGSVTGAPKRRAMEIIAELEPAPRGFYTGGIGLLDPRGNCEIGLPIRTGVVEGGVLRYHAGGGIVVDSDPDRELDECWLKTAAVRAALAGDSSALDRCSSG